MGAIEGNIDKILANRFKKRGMSWSPSGALNLAKVGQLIINDDWLVFINWIINKKYRSVSLECIAIIILVLLLEFVYYCLLRNMN